MDNDVPGVPKFWIEVVTIPWLVLTTLLVLLLINSLPRLIKGLDSLGH